MMRLTMLNQRCPMPLLPTKHLSKFALGDAEKMATQLNMQIATHTWVKKLMQQQQQLTLDSQRWR